MIKETYAPLIGLYAPKINLALDEGLGLGFSAVGAWTILTDSYNVIMDNTLTQIALYQAGITLPVEINDDIGEFATGKALDGLCFMVGEEEKKIRKDSYAWAIDIIQKVFGSLIE